MGHHIGMTHSVVHDGAGNIINPTLIRRPSLDKYILGRVAREWLCCTAGGIARFFGGKSHPSTSSGTRILTKSTLDFGSKLLLFIVG